MVISGLQCQHQHQRTPFPSIHNHFSYIPVKIHLLKVGDDKLLKPTGYVMHHQFNIQQLYTLPTLYLCFLYLPENKQRLVPLTV
jgi:hypothetical protein